MDDLEEIRQLKARYSRTMDTKDWAAMREVFTDDVVMDTSEAGGSIVNGADDFLAFLQEALGGAVTVEKGPDGWRIKSSKLTRLHLDLSQPGGTS